MDANPTISDALLRTYRAKGLEIFYVNGYYASSEEDLLTGLNISKDEFQSLFGSKEEFCMGILQNLVFPEILNLLIEPSRHSESPFRLLLDVFGNAIENACTFEKDRGSMLALFMAEFKGKNNRISKYLSDIVRIWNINIVTILKKGKKDGYIDQYVDCESAANFILASYFGARTMMIQGNVPELKESFIQQLSSYFYSLTLSD